MLKYHLVLNEICKSDIELAEVVWNNRLGKEFQAASSELSWVNVLDSSRKASEVVPPPHMDDVTEDGEEEIGSN